jgi:hypothetical protein
MRCEQRYAHTQSSFGSSRSSAFQIPGSVASLRYPAPARYAALSQQFRLSASTTSDHKTPPPFADARARVLLDLKPQRPYSRSPALHHLQSS